MLAMATAFCLLVLFGSAPAFGQTDQGSITGVVTDQTGAAIPGAEVTLTNVDTGLVLTTKVDSSGVYTFAPIKIGNYKISASGPGFSTTTRQDLKLQLQQRLEVNLQLTLGSVEQKIEVSAAAPMMQTEEASVGQEFDSKTMNDTPLNGKNWVYLAQLTAGVTPTTGSRGGGSGDFSANGQSNTQNNFVLNGVDNNVSVVDYLNQASYNVRPPMEALQEFRVQTANYSAEFGHSAGAVVNASIKSGTNQIHGSAWEYVRNTALNAKDWTFSSVPPYHQNQFGATLGLPIIKNKLFFFSDFENNRISATDPANLVTVPTAKMRTGDFSDLLDTSYTGSKAIQLFEPGTNVQIPGNRLDLDPNVKLDAVALKILGLYPCPNVTKAAGLQKNCPVNRPVTDNTFTYDARMDWNIGSKDQVFASFSSSNRVAFHTPPLGPILDGGAFYDTGPENFLGQNFALSYSHIFTPTLTNEFRVGFNYAHYTLQQPNADTNVAAQLGLGGIPFGPKLGGLPNVNMTMISGIPATQSLFGGGGGPFAWGGWTFMFTTEHQNIAQLLDNVTKVWGNHTIRTGISLHYIRFSTFQPGSQRGGYTFSGVYTGGATGQIGSGLADFLLDQVASAAMTGGNGLIGPTGLGVSDNLRWDNGAFVQDDWKITRRLTLNLGLRWEDPTQFRDLKGRIANFVVNSPLGINSGTATYLFPNQPGGNNLPLGNFQAIAGPRVAIAYTPNQYLVNSAWANFAPRLGLAYKLTDRLVIRTGYGLFYGGLSPIGYGPSPSADFPFLSTSNFVAASCSGSGNCPVAKSNLGNPITLETGFADILKTGVIPAVTSPSVNGIDPNTKAGYSENYNLTTEYALTNSTAMTVGYIGSQAHNMQALYNLNTAYGVMKTGSNINPVRAFPGLGNVLVQKYVGQNHYDSLQATFSKRGKGLTYQANYTWSNQIALAAPASPLVPWKSNVTGQYQQRFTFNGNYQLPFGTGRRFANSSRLLDYFVGGWAASLSFVAQTGTPFTVNPSNIPNVYAAAAGATSVLGFSPPVIMVGDPYKGGGTPPAGSAATSCPATVRTRTNWYNPCAFIVDVSASGLNIPTGTVLTGAAALPYFGKIRSKQIYGPGNNRVNMSLFKEFGVREWGKLTFRADVFNLLNHPSWSNPSDTGISSTGGAITSPVTFQTNTPDARFFQLSLKFTY